MKTKNILIGLVVIVVGAFGIQTIVNNTKTDSASKVTINDLGTFNNANRAEAVQRFAGKPTVVFIVGTFCPHCQSAMPKYKTDIWDKYKEKTNIFAHVIDGDKGKRFEVSDIPQGYDTQLSFENLTGESCDFVPSWVLLDSTGKTVGSSCGAKKGIEVIQSGLNNLLNSQELPL